MADKNVIDMFHKKSKPIVIIMDEIDRFAKVTRRIVTDFEFFQGPLILHLN